MTGSVTFDGTTVTAVEMTADLTTLQSDNDRRDGQLRQQALETDTFPTATFTLTEPIQLDAVPADGEVVCRDRDRRPDAPRPDPVGPDPDRGRPVGRHRDRHRLDRDRLRRLRHQPAELVHGPLDRRPRDHGAPAPADDRPPRRPTPCRAGRTGRRRRRRPASAPRSPPAPSRAPSSGVARNAADSPGIHGIRTWITITSRPAVSRNVFRGSAPYGSVRLRFA